MEAFGWTLDSKSNWSMIYMYAKHRDTQESAAVKAIVLFPQSYAVINLSIMHATEQTPLLYNDE